MRVKRRRRRKGGGAFSTFPSLQPGEGGGRDQEDAFPPLPPTNPFPIHENHGKKMWAMRKYKKGSISERDQKKGLDAKFYVFAPNC